MSLRIFHICFITISTLLCAGCAWWGYANRVEGIFTWGSTLGMVVLPIYGVWFLKKTALLTQSR